MSNTLNIYQRINNVMKTVEYVKKDSSVSGMGGGYKAVSHDQVVSVARKALVDNGVNYARPFSYATCKNGALFWDL